MGKLKLLKSRSQHQTGFHAPDLRGLGQEVIFTESHPYVALSILGLGSASEINWLISKFNLKNMGSTQPKVIHLTLQQCLEGAHKEQAVQLFTAGLMLLQKFPTLHLHLHQVNRLHHLLTVSVKNQKKIPPHFSDVLIEKWLKKPCAMTVAADITFYLNQAGFLMQKEGVSINLNIQDVNRQIEFLTHQKEHKKSVLQNAGS